MRSKRIRIFVRLACLTVISGCSTPYMAPELPNISSSYLKPNWNDFQPASQASANVGVDHKNFDGIVPTFESGKSNWTENTSLEALSATLLANNPRLAQFGWAVEVARGRAIQAGLYPNPQVSITGNELGDRTGPSGIWSVPFISQEIVTAGKLSLSEAAAQKEVNQAELQMIAERYRLLTLVRQAFYEVLSLQRRSEILSELVQLSEKTVKNTERLLVAKEVSRLDLVQLQVDLERYRTEHEATEKQIPAAFRKLTAIIGIPSMPYAKLIGSLEETLPEFELEQVRKYVVEIHPEVRISQIGVERANLLLKRAEVEPIPNITVGSGYTRQGQNRSNDWDVGVNFSVPLWNKNQGNIFAARAQISEATQEINRVKNDLTERLTTSYSAYASAKKRAERYKSVIIPKAEESNVLSQKAYQGGQFEYLRVLQSQRAVAEARLEYVRALAEMWHGATGIAGLMLEDQWPVPTIQKP